MLYKNLLLCSVIDFFIGVRQIGARIPNKCQVSNSVLMKNVGVVLTIPTWSTLVLQIYRPCFTNIFQIDITCGDFEKKKKKVVRG